MSGSMVSRWSRWGLLPWMFSVVTFVIPYNEDRCSRRSSKSKICLGVTSKKFTAEIKEAISITEVLNLLNEEVDGKIFNHYHASAAYHSLAILERKHGVRNKEKTHPVWSRLARRVQEMVENDEVQPQTVANVLWSLGQLFSHRVNISHQLLGALIKSVKKTAVGMKPQELSNCLLAALQLKDFAANVLTVVPVIATEISIKANAMRPQELSNSLRVSAQLKEDIDYEDVEKISCAIAEQIPKKAMEMIPQHLSNALWAAAYLKHTTSHMQGAVRAIISQIPSKAKRMKPQELSNSIWATSRLEDLIPANELATMLPYLAKEICLKASMMTPQAVSNSLWGSSFLFQNLAFRHHEVNQTMVPMVLALLKELPKKEAKFLPQEFANSLEALIRLEDAGLPEVATFLRGKRFVRSAALRFTRWIPKLKGKDLQLALPVVLWVCGRLGIYHQEFLASTAYIFTSENGEVSLSSLGNWHLCVMLSSYRLLDPKNEFSHFKWVLKSHILQRGLGEFDIQRSQLGEHVH